MTDGQGDRLRVLVVAAYPALRAGLVSLLARDRLLEPMAAEGVQLGDAGSAPSAIVVDYSAGEPEEILTIAEAFPGTALVMIGADPGTDGPGLSGAPVAYLPSEAYAPPARAIEVTTGVATVVASLFGPCPICMAALVTPLTAGPEAGERSVHLGLVQEGAEGLPRDQGNQGDAEL